MPETKIPGLKASHQIISPICRENRGEMGALEEAFERIRATYWNCQNPDTAHWNFHVVLVADSGENG